LNPLFLVGKFGLRGKALGFRYFAAFCVASALSGTALAADGQCRVGRVAELPVTMTGLQPMVHAKINGREAVFVADSGAFFSMISPGSAAEYGLSLERLPMGFRVIGVGGSVDPMLTTVKSFTLAGVDIPRVQFLVGGSEVGSVGLLGQNVLAIMDTEFDLAHGMIRLMRSENCSKANLAYWVKPGEAYSVVETESSQEERPHIYGTVYVNGVKLRAMFDTGAATSSVSLKAAARFGLKPDGPGVKPSGVSGGIGRSFVHTWIGPIQSIKIGDEEVRNTQLRFGGDFTDVDMLIGADFFLSHHVYWSNHYRKLFFTFNGGHVFDLSYLREAPGAKEPAAATPTPEDDSAAAPTSADGYSRRGAARAARGDFTGALADLDQAVKLAPDNADFLRQRAELHMRLRQPVRALDDLDSLIKLKSDDVDAHLLRAELRRRLDRGADISADLDAAAAAAPKSSDRRLAIADLYETIDDFPHAIAQFDLWIAAHPDDRRKPIALNGRCWARALAGTGLEQALKDCNSALSGMPHNPVFLDSRGLVHLRMGDFAKAIADYDEAIAKNDKAAWSYYGRGLAKLRLGQKDAGEADLAKAKSLGPAGIERAKKLGIVP
jgi:tetratricopeptide (TPR) repeat protein/predicted aspartyl protease